MKKNRALGVWGLVLSFVLTTLGLAGCSVATLQSKPITNLSTPHSLAYYHLKQRKFEITLTRELTKCEWGDEPDINVNVTADLVASTIADPNHRYEIIYNELATGRKKVQFSLEYDENLTIKGINAKVEDQTAAIIKSVLSATTSIAKAAFPAATISAMRAAQVELCNANTLAALAVVNGSVKEKIVAKKEEARLNKADIDAHLTALAKPTSDTPHLLSELRKRREKEGILKAEIESLRSQLNRAESTIRIVTRQDLAPDWELTDQGYVFQTEHDLELRFEDWKIWLDPAMIAFLDKAENADKKKIIEDRLKVEALLVFEQPPTYVAPPKTSDRKIDGILFRDSVEAKLKLCHMECAQNEVQTGVTKYEGVFTVPQASPLLMLTLVNNTFQNNSVKVTFLADGRVGIFEYGDNARLAALAESAAASAETLSGTIESVRARDIREQERKKQRLTLEKEILTLEDEIEKLKQP